MSIDAIEKTVYLCSGKRTAMGTITSATRSTSVSTTTDQDGGVTVTVPMQPVSDVSVDNTISVGLLKNSETWATKQTPYLRLKLISSDTSAPYWAHDARVEFKIPSACDWTRTDIIKNLSAGSVFGSIAPNIQAGEIPAGKDAVIMFSGWETSLNGTSVIIGDRLDALNYYHFIAPLLSNDTYFHTQYFCGGKVVARRAHATIENLLTYDVESEGQTIIDILPTDYFLYNIGDDVFPFVIGDDRSQVSLEPSFPAGSFRMAPLAFGGRGVAFGLSFSLFREYANMRVLVGSVVSVSATSNSAVVLINGSEYTLEIVYYCADGSTDKGSRAFKAGDIALVLWSGYRSSQSSLDMKIIGFSDTVIPCITGGFVVFPRYGIIGRQYPLDIYTLSMSMNNPYLLSNRAINGPLPNYRMGNQHWHGDAGIIQWTGPSNRYDSHHTGLGVCYYNNIALTTQVSGAALVTIDNVVWIIYVKVDPVTYAKTFWRCLTNDTGHVQLSGTIPTPIRPAAGINIQVFFSSSGRKFVYVIKGEIFLGTINATATSFTINTTDTYTNGLPYNCTYTVAADFIGEGVVYQTVTHETTQQTESSTWNGQQALWRVEPISNTYTIGNQTVNGYYDATVDSVTRYTENSLIILYQDLRDGYYVAYQNNYTYTRHVIQNLHAYSDGNGGWTYGDPISTVLDEITESTRTLKKIINGSEYTRVYTNENRTEPYQTDLFDIPTWGTNFDHVPYLSNCGVYSAYHPEFGRLSSVIIDKNSVVNIAPNGVLYNTTPLDNKTNLFFSGIGII